MKNVVPLLFSLFFFFALEYEAKKAAKKSQNDILHVKTSLYVKNLRDPTEKKFTKKVTYPPFAGIPSIYDMTQEHDEGQGLTSFDKDFDPFPLFIRKSS